MDRKQRIPLHDHSDFNTGGRLPTGSIAGYGPSSIIVTGTSSTGATALADLSDVDLVTTPPADLDSLTYDAATGKWVPSPAVVSLALDDLSDVTITTPVAADRLRFDGAGWANSPLRWEPHVSYDGTVVLDGIGNPVMHEVSY